MEQIGKPEEIYDNPKTRFVAEFIGEMNFLEEGGTSFAVRPEDITLIKQENGPYRILQMMSLGHYTQAIVVDNKGNEVKVFMEKDEARLFAADDCVACRFDRKQVFAA